MKKLFLALLVIVGIGTIGATSVFAKEKDQKKTVVVSADSTVDRDFFATGDEVIISGTVNGDVYVLAGKVVVDGQINGDLIAAGETVDISGRIAQDVRVAAGDLRIGGKILGSMTAGAGQIVIDGEAAIGKSVLIGAGSLRVDGSIERGATIGASEVILNSYIGQDAKIGAEKLTVSENAKINGDLNYWSDNDALIRNSDSVSGTITKHATASREAGNDARHILGGFALFWKLTAFLSSLILGFVLLKLVPVFMSDVIKSYKTKPIASLGIGLLSLILAPIFFVLLLITVIGIPFAVFLVFGMITILMLSKVFIAIFVGDYLKARLKLNVSAFGTLGLGLIVWTALTALPVIGGVLSFIGCVSAVGALLVTKKSYYKMLSAKKLI